MVDDVTKQVVLTAATQSPVDVENVSDIVVFDDRHLGASATSNNSVVLPSHKKGT